MSELKRICFNLSAFLLRFVCYFIHMPHKVMETILSYLDEKGRCDRCGLLSNIHLYYISCDPISMCTDVFVFVSKQSKHCAKRIVGDLPNKNVSFNLMSELPYPGKGMRQKIIPHVMHRSFPHSIGTNPWQA